MGGERVIPTLGRDLWFAENLRAARYDEKLDENEVTFLEANAKRAGIDAMRWRSGSPRRNNRAGCTSWR
jgi:hypothetical protein